MYIIMTCMYDIRFRENDNYCDDLTLIEYYLLYLSNLGVEV